MNIQLSDHFTYKRLLRFAIPSVVMMIFTSIYGVVDGFFVSNYIGETEFAAVNFIMPYLMLFDSIGFMLSTGGSALVAMLLGRREPKRANEIFSMLIYLAICLGTFFFVLTEVFLRPVAVFLGAEGELLEAAVLYGRIILITFPAFMLQYTFQSFFVTAEKPNLGLAFTAIAGISNIILDWLFMAVFKWGIAGAAAASCIGQVIGGFGPFIYFLLPNRSLLRLCKTKFDGRALLKSCSNGLSELLTNASMSLVNMVYNVQLIKLAGEYGVAAYGIIMYVNFMFVAAFIGYTMGVAPIVSYNYGAKNNDELHGVTNKSLIIVGIASVTLIAIAEIFAKPLAMIFAGYDETFLAISIRALKLYCTNYIFAGYNIFAAGFFAALNNGKIAGIVSAVRILVLQLLCVMIIPIFLGTDGIWISMLCAETGTVILSIIFFIKNKKKYHY